MLNFFSVLFAVVKGNIDYDDIIADCFLSIREVIAVLEKYPKYFSFQWESEFIRTTDEGNDLVGGYALVRRYDGKPLWVGKVEKIYDRPNR